MNILYIIGTLILSATSAAQAQELTTVNSSVTKVKDSVVVRFEAKLDKLPTNYRIVAAPKLYSNNDTINLPSMIFSGRIQRIKDMRSNYGYGDAIVVGKSNSITYKQTIAFEKWMANSSLEISTQIGVCGKKLLSSNLVRENNLVPIIPEIKTIEFVASSPSTTLLSDIKMEIEDVIVEEIAPNMTKSYPFVYNKESYDYENLKLYRDNGVPFYFRINSSIIDLDYLSNKQSFEKVKIAIKYIQKNYGLELNRIVLVGTSSIDGSYDFNLKLSKQRGNSLIRYI